MNRQELAEAQKLLVELDSLLVVQEQMRNPPLVAPLDGGASLTFVRILGTIGVYPVFDFKIDVGEIPKFVVLLESRLAVVREQLKDLGVDATLTEEAP